MSASAIHSCYRPLRCNRSAGKNRLPIGSHFFQIIDWFPLHIQYKRGSSSIEIVVATCVMAFCIMMNAREYRSRSTAATARADLEMDQVIKAHHRADAESWEALANMAERHAAAMEAFKV